MGNDLLYATGSNLFAFDVRLFCSFRTIKIGFHILNLPLSFLYKIENKLGKHIISVHYLGNLSGKWELYRSVCAIIYM